MYIKNNIKNISQYLCLALIGLLISIASAYADNSEYQDVTMRLLTDHMFEEKAINFDNPLEFKEYTMIEDCEIFEEFFTNDFEWNRIRLAMKTEMEGLKPKKDKVKIRIPGLVDIVRYNFATQAFDIYEDDIFADVGLLQISAPRFKICNEKYDESSIGRGLPNKYFLKPEVPLNLRRIPVSKIVAQNILDQIQPNKDKTRSVYIDINVTLDTIFEVDKKAKKGAAGHILGAVDSVDFFMDEFRQKKFKTIYYDVY